MQAKLLRFVEERVFHRVGGREERCLIMSALAERRSDIPALAAYFLAQKAGALALTLSPEAMKMLERYDWPGNDRRPRRAPSHCAIRERASSIPKGTARRGFALSPPGSIRSWKPMRLTEAMHDEIEALALRHLPARFDGKPTVLARETGINGVTLRRKWRELGTAVP